MDGTAASPSPASELAERERLARIERNRQRALEIRRAKLAAASASASQGPGVVDSGRIAKPGSMPGVSHFTDTRAGYMIPNEEKAKRIALAQERRQRLRQRQKEALLERKARMFASIAALNGQKAASATAPSGGASAAPVAVSSRSTPSAETQRSASAESENDEAISSAITDEELIALEAQLDIDEHREEMEQGADEIDDPDLSFWTDMEQEYACEECAKLFTDSYLHKNFRIKVCNVCRAADTEDKFSLITKSDAKNLYLLADEDFAGKNGSFLPFITKKNPRHASWHEMQLFCIAQVEAVAFKRHGGPEGLEKARDQREQAREVAKQKKHDKKMDELRKSVRASNWLKQKQVHQHVFRPESEEFDAKQGVWTKMCECGHSVSFEKM